MPLIKKALSRILKVIGITILVVGAYFFFERHKMQLHFLSYPKSPIAGTVQQVPVQVKGGLIYASEEEVSEFNRKAQYYQISLIVGCLLLAGGIMIQGRSK